MTNSHDAEDFRQPFLSSRLFSMRGSIRNRQNFQPIDGDFRKTRKLVRRLNAIYVDAARDGGLDNAESDALLDVLGKHFAGRAWPRSGGMDATRHFMANLRTPWSAPDGRSIYLQ